MTKRNVGEGSEKNERIHGENLLMLISKKNIPLITKISFLEFSVILMRFAFL